MTFQKLISGIKLFTLVGSLVISTTAFSQKSGAKDQPDNSRAKLEYKQTHGINSPEEDKLFADGFQLKMDMSLLNEAANVREIDMDAIPAEELYGGIWVHSKVDAYGRSVDAPSEFEVDLADFTIPVEGHVTSNFGRRGSRRYHYGIDIKAQTGDTIYAAFDGKVRVRQYDRRGYGYFVVMRHLNGLETLYGHMSKFLVEENDFIMSGQPIGLAGNTGRSFGSHLHFETRFLGKPIDPNFIIDFEHKVTHRDTYLVTNDSYKKTTLSSRVVKRTGTVNYVQATNRDNNKFVSNNAASHTIRRGDTLERIARRYGVTINQLCALNNISRTTTLRIGRSLIVNSTSTASTDKAESSGESQYHKVNSGDTLGAIAQRYGV
ncbi:MAG: peptidoglycan DD-metalloendopeptidase family protein, partial [Bacteroidales bacterium]|nr:peptidoglycan DD-metalloendopeptidase family protein [Bacteroidales bacterium]